MKYIYSLLLALFIAVGVQAQNCVWTANTVSGNTVVLNSQTGFPALLYSAEWDLGDGSVIHAPIGPFTYQYASAGVYNVCLTIYDDSTNLPVCSYCDSLSVFVNANCTFTYIQDSINPSMIYFFANASNPTSSINWSFGDGSAGSGSFATHTYNASGSYFVTMQELDSAGNVVCTYTATVVAGSNPTSTCGFAYLPGGPGTQNTYTFNGTSSLASPTYYWDFGDNTPMQNGQNTTHTFATAGAFNVTMYVIDGVDTCVFSQTIPVPVGGSCSINVTPDSSVSTAFFFDALTANSNTTISWDFGDGATATGMSVYHAYNSPGTYNVCISEVNFFGVVVCSYCQQVTVGGGSTPNCNFTVSNSPANPTYYNFSIPQAPGVTYVWNLGNGQTQTGNNVGAGYQSGTYTVCLTASNGTTSSTCCTTIVVTGTPNCSFTYFPDSANANTYYFIASPSQSGSTIMWHFGDSTTSVGQSISHTYPGPGSYYACMTEIDPATGAILCSYCTTIVVSSNGNCSFTVTSSPGNPSVVTFTANSLIGTTFIWDFGDNTTGNGQNITHTYANPGVYNVCLSIGVGGAITCTYCQTITIPGNSWCQASFTSVSLGLNAYFIDQSSIIPITMPPVPPTVNYAWDFGDGSTSTLQFPNHQYAAPGSYMVCLTASTVGCTSTFCDTIVIDTIINNPITCNAFFVFTQTTPYNVVGVNLSSGINLSFNWDFGDGSTANTPYPTHQYNGTGSYLVCLTVADANGCSSTYCDSLTVDSLGNVVYRGATSSGFTLNIVAPNVLGVEDNQPAIGSLYPVPASSELNIRFSDNVKEEVTYNVLSIDGRRIMNGQLNGTTATLNIESLQQGIYLLEVITSDGQRDSKYFVKQ